MARVHLLDSKKIWQYLNDMEIPFIFGETLDILYKKIMKKKNEEGDDVQYEYIDLVYPPGSNPPTRNSTKKMNLIGFNQISLE